MRAVREAPANPASLHRPGRHAQAVLEQARDRVAAVLRCNAREVLFCGSATEANNLAVLGAARALERLNGPKPRLISSLAEHPAVLSPLRLLQQEGFPLVCLGLDPCARLSAEELTEALDCGPALLALQWANNETGAVQPLPESLPGAVHFHCDGAQGFGKLPWDPRLAQASTLVLSGHKFRAPKGIAVLQVRDDALLDPVLAGGGQQRGIRPGTESPELAAAFACAMELAARDQDSFSLQTREACRAMMGEVRGFFAAKDLPAGARLQENHPPAGEPTLPNTLNLSFAGIDGRGLLPACDAEGLALSSGSACSSGSSQPSPVLRACGLDLKLARATVRVSFGWGQGRAEGEDAGGRLCQVLRRVYKCGKR
ncbi:MAG: aminotransferase class V-fold PLP-dependent enzyme [Planctomycetes bacterium]|nr:aminotransferase class V-fold PLP-dependent enzyme [Planctomycetota bacterium]MBL7008398.1 aminotransferase class V-fold PLP-dependent enzyme [Planctomycetota bacterium]